MMPGIMNQLGPDNMKDLRKMMGAVRGLLPEPMLCFGCCFGSCVIFAHILRCHLPLSQCPSCCSARRL